MSIQDKTAGDHRFIKHEFCSCKEINYCRNNYFINYVETQKHCIQYSIFIYLYNETYLEQQQHHDLY